MQNQIRQGDVFLKTVNATPDGKRKKIRAERGRLILARGEATGHHHSVCADVAELFDFGGQMVLVVAEPTPLEHQEHAPIEIAPGTYFVIRQREYSPSEIRKVMD